MRTTAEIAARQAALDRVRLDQIEGAAAISREFERRSDALLAPYRVRPGVIGMSDAQAADFQAKRAGLEREFTERAYAFRAKNDAEWAALWNSAA